MPSGVDNTMGRTREEQIAELARLMELEERAARADLLEISGRDLTEQLGEAITIAAGGTGLTRAEVQRMIGMRLAGKRAARERQAGANNDT